MSRDDQLSQLADLKKHVNIWARCTNTSKEFTCMWDLNLCFKKWNDAGYPHATLANEIKDFLISENCSTLVEDYTRMRQVDGSIQRSSLDQVISNCSSKMSRPEIIGVGKSDHLGVFITKYSKEVRTSPLYYQKKNT